VLHQIPSGIIQGAVCLVGNGVVLDPETLFTELDALSERGIRTEHKLYVSDRAHLTLPFHKLLPGPGGSGADRYDRPRHRAHV